MILYNSKKAFMKNRATVILLLVILPIVSYSQNTTNTHKHKHKPTKTVTTGIKLPEWAPAHNYDATAHVYFPDYYTYYDPARGGYVYWVNGQYTFSPSLPPFLEKVDLGKSRIQILKGLSLDLHPEQNYPYYMKMYPPDDNGNTMVPVPTMGNPAH
jgi:hypothetical protein